MSQEQQSPIDLTEPIYADLGDKGLKIHWNGVAKGRVVQDHEGLKVGFSPDAGQYIKLGGKTYHLKSFHFHHPSEHWVNGEQFAVELHVVHKNTKDGTLAVVGIFLEVGETKSKCPELVSRLGEFLAPKSEQGEIGDLIETDPNAFLPANLDDYYRYEGSLTTPEFDETVSWAVLRTPFFMRKEELSSLIQLLGHTARFPEPLNRRFILSTFRESPVAPAPPSGSTKSKPSGKKMK